MTPCNKNDIEDTRGSPNFVKCYYFMFKKEYWKHPELQTSFLRSPITVSFDTRESWSFIRIVKTMKKEISRHFNIFTTATDWVKWILKAVFKLTSTNMTYLNLQSWSKYFWAFSSFNEIFLYHMWNGTRILSPENGCTNYLPCFQTT